MVKVRVSNNKKNLSFLSGKSPDLRIQEKHQFYVWEKSGCLFSRKTPAFWMGKVRICIYKKNTRFFGWKKFGCRPCPKYGYTDLPSPSPSEVVHISWKISTVLKRLENWKSDLPEFHFLSYGWLCLQFTVTHQVCHRPEKKFIQKWSKSHVRCALLWPWFISSWVFFCATFSFWDMVDFV